MLHVHEWGERERPVLLFWHGSGDDGRQGEALAGLGFRVLAPDAPGHGASRGLAPDAYLPSRLARLAVGVLDERGVRETVVAGFSWGGTIACHVAAAWPERTAALVLLEGGHLDFADVPGLDDERGLAELVADEGLGGALAWGLRREPAVGTYPALRRARVPVLLVTAMRTQTAARLREDPLARLSAQVPQAEIHRIEAGGHELLGARAGEVMAAVGGWLRRVLG